MTEGENPLKRPNILFLIADDHRHDAVHALGDATVQTPVLDALAKRATTYLNVHTMGGYNAAVCSPSRASLLTGRQVFRSLTWPNQDALLSDATTLPQWFRANGWHTFETGKWHHDHASFQRSFCDAAAIYFGGMYHHVGVPVFDYAPDGRYPDDARRVTDVFSTELFANAAIEFIEKYDRDEPFFLYAAFTAPHDPRTPPPEYAQLYDPEQVPLPPNFAPEHPFDNGALRTRDEKLAGFPRTAAEVRQHIADYYGMISHLDAQVGRILAALDHRGVLADTIVVYTADHGLAVGQHGLLGKQNVYDHSIRIPALVAGPGVAPGAQIEDLMYQMDLFPTLCRYAGIELPPGLDARAVTEPGEGRDTLCAVYYDMQSAIKTAKWKWIRYNVSAFNGKGTQRVQLFNLREDPWETRDLSSDSSFAQLQRDLAGQLQEWEHSVQRPTRW